MAIKFLKRFHHGFILKLKNHEYAELIKRIYHTTDVKAFGETNAAECYKELLSFKEDVDFIKRQNTPHPLTKVLKKKAVDRKNMLLAIRYTLFAGTMSLVEGERAAARLLLQWLSNNFGNRLYRVSLTSQSNGVRTLMHEYSLRSDVQEGVSMMKLSAYLDTIEELTQEIDDMLDKRTRELVANAKKAAEIRKVVYEVLKKFLVAIELEASMEVSGADVFEEYMRRLNSIFDYYRTPLNARNTRNRNETLKAKEEDKEDDLGNENENNNIAMGNGGGEAAMFDMGNMVLFDSSRESENAKWEDIE